MASNVVAISGMECEQFSDYLLCNGVHSDVAATILANRINGELFAGLCEEDLKEIAPVLGDRIRLRNILDEIRKVGQESSSNEVAAGVSAESSLSTIPEEANSTSQIKDVVPPQKDWHQEFSIPELNTFSDHVKGAVSSGLVTGRARREIVQVLRTYVTARTLFPKSEHYNAICYKLVLKYPKLEDDEGQRTYGSWKMGLRNSFKNLRRGCTKEKDERSDTSISTDQEPPRKRARNMSCSEDGLELSQLEYEEALSTLQAEYKKKLAKKQTNPSEVKRLMAMTRMKRQAWIKSDCPLVSEVIGSFPHLRSSTWVWREFRVVVSIEGSVKEIVDNNWPIWKTKIIEFSKLESKTRPFLKKLLGVLDNLNDLACSDDASDFICLELLCRLLYARGFPKDNVFLRHFERCDIDLDSQVAVIKQSEPYLIVTGRPGEESSQVFISCEEEIFIHSRSIRDGLVDLMAIYFTFDITYPKYTSAVLLFLQHYVFDLKDEQPLPPVTSKLIANLEKIELV